MRARQWAPAALVGLALVGAGLYVAFALRISTSLTHFLPAAERDDAAILEHLADSELTRTVVLTVAARTPKRARQAAKRIARGLAEQPQVAWVRSGVGDATRDAVYQVYFPQRLHFLSDHPERDLPRVLSEGGLRERAADLKARLGAVTGSLVRRIAPEDPLLSFFGVLRRLEALRAGGLTTRDGVLMTRDGKRAVVLLASRKSAFDAPASERLMAEIGRVTDRVRTQVGSDVVVEQSALHRFAVHTERVVRADVTRVSVVSTLAVLLLFVVVFRSLRAFALALIPVAAGVLAALAATLAIFGRVHGLTLAFGSTLVGVAVDYGVHLLGHHALGPSGRSAFETRGRVWPALRLGALTTVAGLAGLAWTDFPGIREMAWFAAIGVLAALVTTWAVLPVLMGPGGGAPPLQRALAARIASTFEWITMRWPVAALMLGAGVAVAVLGIPRIRWVDDPRALQQADPGLLAEEARVRSEVGRMDAGYLVAAMGRDTEAALEVNDRVSAALGRARAHGELASFRSLHQALWSADLQRRNVARLRAVPDLRARFARAFAAEGFVPNAFAPFFAAVDSVPAPLTFDALARSRIGDMVRPFRLRLGGRVAVLTFLAGVRDPGAVSRRVNAVRGARFVDRSAVLSRAYGHFRRRTLELMTVGLLLVLGLVALRYRRWRPTIAAFVPAMVAGAAALGVIGLLGRPANLLHVVACLLVLSMGVDYGVFVVEHRHDDSEAGATWLGVVVACLTTVASFGLLAMSGNPALRAVGTTTGVGVLLALALAPAALGLVRAGARR